MLGIDLTQRREKVAECRVGNVFTRCKGVRGFGSVSLRCELAQDGATGFGIGKGCSGMVLKTQE